MLFLSSNLYAWYELYRQTCIGDYRNLFSTVMSAAFCSDAQVKCKKRPPPFRLFLFIIWALVWLKLDILQHLKSLKGGQSTKLWAAQTVTVFGEAIPFTAPELHDRNCTTIPIGVLSGNATKRQSVRETWGKNVCVYFIVGKKEGQWPEEEAGQYADLVLVDMEEVYHGATSILPYKTSLWFCWASRQFPQAQHILKTDDDCYVHVAELESELTHQNADYWGFVHRKTSPVRDPQIKYSVPLTMWRGNTFPDYCSGAGYALSRKALQCFVEKIGSQTYMALEDVCTGIVMHACNFQATPSVLVDISGKIEESSPWLIKHYVQNFPKIALTDSGFGL